MKHNAKPMPRAAREIGQTAVLKTRRVAPKISGDFASSVMGKYLGTENYRNFFVRMIFHMMPEEAKEKGKTEVIHHTHIYNRYLRVYKTVKSAPVYRIFTAVRKETVKEQKETQLLRKETERHFIRWKLQPITYIYNYNLFERLLTADRAGELKLSAKKFLALSDEEYNAYFRG